MGKIGVTLYADDTVVVADCIQKLQRTGNGFSKVIERKKLKVNVGKSNIDRILTGEIMMG